ncbi:MAG: PTS sugar transporter subunit IIA [Sulfuricella sp.]|nr:PTS sugar transporter subunit IIA [Sulfuricella sp.]
MSLVAELLPLCNVLADLEVGSKQALLEKLGELFESGNPQLAHAKVTESLATREKLGSTAMGHSIAIPHGRIKGLREAVGAFVRLKTPLPFDAPDGRPVSLVFVLLVPQQATDLHLLILGELAELFSEKSLRDALHTAPDAAALHRLLAS